MLFRVWILRIQGWGVEVSGFGVAPDQAVDNVDRVQQDRHLFQIACALTLALQLWSRSHAIAVAGFQVRVWFQVYGLRRGCDTAPMTRPKRLEKASAALLSIESGMICAARRSFTCCVGVEH